MVKPGQRREAGGPRDSCARRSASTSPLARAIRRLAHAGAPGQPRRLVPEQHLGLEDDLGAPAEHHPADGDGPLHQPDPGRAPGHLLRLQTAHQDRQPAHHGRLRRDLPALLPDRAARRDAASRCCRTSSGGSSCSPRRASVDPTLRRSAVPRRPLPPDAAGRWCSPSEAPPRSCATRARACSR